MPWSIVGVIAGLAALVGGWFWWWWPKRQVDRLRLTDPKARADVEDNFRKTIGQILGGAAVLFGAWLAYLQFSQQQQASQQQFSQQQQTSQQQFLEQRQASRDLLISNQVAKGFEQLGSDKVDVRLGGIYALEGVMNTSEQYHKPVLEALSAFVRDGTKTVTGNEAPATDIQAALTVIGRRRVGGTRVDLTYAHIPTTDLRSANLSGAWLSNAYLVNANLSHANLRTAFLPDTNLSHAGLFAADLTDADLTRSDLTGAVISQAQLDKACGSNVQLDPGLTIKPCPARR